MIIKLYQFTKRSNSTAIPTTSGYDCDVRLKDQTSVLRPSFLLAQVDDNLMADLYRYNYVYCATFARYYHVVNVESVRHDLWQIDCAVDVLASYKAQIQATTAFVTYSTTLGNAQIIDRRLSVMTPKTIAQQTASFTEFGVVTSGNKAVVMTVTGENSVGHYVMAPAVASTLLNSIDTWMDQVDVLPWPSSTGFQAVVDALAYIGQSFTSFARQFISTGNAADNITNVISVPVVYTRPSGTNQEILLGKFETGVQATFVAESSGYRYVADSCSIPIPWQTADFRRQAPYTSIALYIPFIGYINISPAQVMGDVAISVSVLLDVFSGDTIFRVYGIPDVPQNAHLIGQYTTNCAASFAVGRSNQTPLQVGTNLISAAGGAISAVSGNVIAGSSAAINGIIGAMETQPTCISTGGGSVAMGLVDSSVCRLVLTYHDTNVNPASVNATIGRPTMETAQLGSLSGYVETACASVSGSMTETERDEINTALNRGVYIE